MKKFIWLSSRKMTKEQQAALNKLGMWRDDSATEIAGRLVDSPDTMQGLSDLAHDVCTYAADEHATHIVEPEGVPAFQAMLGRVAAKYKLGLVYNKGKGFIEI